MLLILSENSDYSTNDVIDWLMYNQTDFYRINDTSILFFLSGTLENAQVDWEISVVEKTDKSIRIIKSKEITSYWYRRGYLNMPASFSLQSSDNLPALTHTFRQYLDFNQKELIELLYKSLEEKKHIGSFSNNFITKLNNLQVAQKFGLSIPDTAVVSTKRQLKLFVKQHEQVITKGIKSNSFNISPTSAVSSLTQIIKWNDLQTFSDYFAPSLIQKYIAKLFELRIFYLDGKCYAAAIFSQNDERTKVDFRNYNEHKPNRVIPYKLPFSMELKIKEFMTFIKMSTGSIDIIVSDKMEYYFLEVNPVGQFGWISRNCNFQLEKLIANYFN